MFYLSFIYIPTRKVSDKKHSKHQRNLKVLKNQQRYKMFHPETGTRNEPLSLINFAIKRNLQI